MKIRFWGVRGSYPVPGPQTNKYGGNTSCLEVRLNDGTLIIFDAGSGIRMLGKSLMANGFSTGKGSAHVLISHTHWDHIQGFPHFRPAYVAGNHFDIWARHFDHAPLRDVFSFQHHPQYFPRALDEMSSTLLFHEVDMGRSFCIGSATIHPIQLNHPNIAVGYRVEEGGKSFAYITDTAPFEDILIGSQFIATPHSPDEAEKKKLKELQSNLLSGISGADVMVYDTFFRLEEYRRNPHWGHSTPEHGIGLCREAGVRALYLFHHAPSMSDDQLDQMGQYYQSKYRSDNIRIEVSAEGQEIEI